MRSTTKAQTEIIGVVIIVIILIIGFFFLMFSRKQADSKQDIENVQLSQAMLNVIMQTNSECGPEFSTIIQDCFNKNEKCPGMNSCNYAEEKIQEILDNTFGIWQKPYSFYATKDNNKKIDINYVGCNEFKEKFSLATAIISDKPNIIVNLGICKI